MNSWYTIKVKYTKQLDDGSLKRVTEPYLVDAVSFTDAEARIYEEIGTSVKGEFLITGISKTDFADIFYYEDCDDWYKCKLTYVSMDADSGKEKKVSQNFLVTAHNVKEAYERIEESMKDMLVTYEIPSIALSPIVEIFPYNPDMDVELERREASPEEMETGVVEHSQEDEEEMHAEAEAEIEDADSVEDQDEDSDLDEEADSTFEDENDKK